MSFYHKPNYNLTQTRQRKNLSPSPHKFGDKTRTGRSIFKEQPPTTQLKRRNQNQEQDFIGHIPKSIYQQQRTNKKTHGLSPYAGSGSIGQSLAQYEFGTEATQNKLQLLKEQNIFFMQQNKHLSQLINQRNLIIQSLQKKLQYQIQQQVLTLEQIQKQKNRFLDEYYLKDVQNKTKIDSLTNQIKRLNENCFNVERSKNQQIQILRQQFNNENRRLVQDVVMKNQKVIEQRQNQISQLSERINRMNEQMTLMQQNHKIDSVQYENKIKQLIQQLEIVNHQKKIQISQQKIAYDNRILELKRQADQNVSNTAFKYDVEMKKIKNLLHERQLEQGNLQQAIETARLEHSNQLQSLLERECQLKNQIFQLQLFYKAAHKSEIEKQKRLHHHQNEIILQSKQMSSLQYQQQVNKLISINQHKSEQIQKLYQEIQRLRQEHESQKQRINQINDELKEKVNEISRNNDDETEMLKIKMSELRHGDLVSLKDYYENQIMIKSQQIIDLQKMIKENRDKLHRELEQRVVQKKKYQYTIDELRIRISELELKMSTMIEQHKQKIHSIGSQMQMSSMTLIRQSTEKQKYSNLSEMEKKKLQQIIQQKDEQIQQLNRIMKIMKQNHVQEIQTKQKELLMIKQKNQQLNNQIKREREFYEKQVSKKQQAKKQTKQFYENQLLNQKQSYRKELNEIVQNISKQKKQLSIEIERLRVHEKQLKDELALYSEHQEQRQIEKDITHSQEKSRLQYAKQSLQINLKTYYEKRLSDVQEQLVLTKQQLTQKSTDLRTQIQKYYKLEKKIQKLMESQEKMRQLEERVLSIGQENNIVKNISEVIKSKKKAA